METSKTCKTCKHWVETRVFGTMDVMKCTSPKFVQGEEPKDDEMAYFYNEGAFFYSGPNFGCIHHIEKE